MNPIDENVQRLFRGAAAPPPAATAPAYGLETRVLAAWRSASVGSAWESGVLARGLVMAGVIMVLSLISLASGSSTILTNDFALTSSIVDSDTQTY